MALALWSCVPCLLSSLLLYDCRVACKYGSISRFKAFLEGFMGFAWVCVVLVLLWLVWLLCACGVRRIRGLRRICLRFVLLPLFLSFCPLLFFFAYLLGLCLCCPRLVLLPALFVLVSLWVFVFSFSLSDYTQKERARRVGASSLRVLWVALFGRCFVLLVLVWA